MLELLERDHRRVESMFARAALCSDEARLALVAHIATALTVHAHVEEKEVYPAMDSALGSATALIGRARDEHEEMTAILDRIASVTGADAEFLTDLRRLQLVVHAHVAVEEGEIFPAFRAAVSQKALRELTARTRDALTSMTPDSSHGGP